MLKTIVGPVRVVGPDLLGDGKPRLGGLCDAECSSKQIPTTIVGRPSINLDVRRPALAPPAAPRTARLIPTPLKFRRGSAGVNPSSGERDLGREVYSRKVSDEDELLPEAEELGTVVVRGRRGRSFVFVILPAY